MSREALHESLSAVMDNEADELELHRVLAASDDAELRATWSRYQIARAAMHKELLEPRLDIAAGVSAALASEASPKASRALWHTLGRLAVAASVTVAVLAGVRFYNQDEVAGGQGEVAQQVQQPSMSTPPMHGTPVLAGYNERVVQPQSQGDAGIDAGQATGWHEQRLPVYLRQHAQQSALYGANGAEAVLPYARAASMDNNR